jgi:hypothetical protein
MQMALNQQTGCTKCLLEKQKGNDNFGDLDVKVMQRISLTAV